MSTSIYDIRKDIGMIYEKFMQLSNPESVKESAEEFKNRKIDCMEATARVMQGRLTSHG